MNIISIFVITNYIIPNNNIINNNCNFDVIRFLKKDIFCVDYGKYKKYCNHIGQPNEFVILKEKGIDNYNYIIKPTALWHQVNNQKYKMANYYYNFVCDNSDNIPKLIQYIVPTSNYDISIYSEIVISIILIILICLILSVCRSNDDTFILGYLIGQTNQSSSYYSE
tara:strand:- start:700 stop:1200 length:501 start_codon:yes stop_codon:yes gene_type:complete